MTEPENKKGVNPLIKIWVLAHMVLTLGWSLPNAAPAIVNGTIPMTTANILAHPVDFGLKAVQDTKNTSPIRYYLESTGLWQYWNMFSPNPANVDFWWDAIVTYKSGKVAIQKYPRMKELSIPEKYIKERYRKYLENMNNDQTDSWKRPDFAQRMALLADRFPGDPPVRVQLRRHWRQMEGMDKPVPKDYNDYVLFDYVVDQDRLNRDQHR